MADIVERILAGEHANIENIRSSTLSISLINDDGCQLRIELMPGQIIGFSAGGADADLVLHRGDPDDLLIIKPESAS